MRVGVLQLFTANAQKLLIPGTSTLTALANRDPRGTNFVCASRDHLLPALSIPAAFVATLCRNDNCAMTSRGNLFKRHR